MWWWQKRCRQKAAPKRKGQRWRRRLTHYPPPQTTTGSRSRSTSKTQTSRWEIHRMFVLLRMLRACYVRKFSAFFDPLLPPLCVKIILRYCLDKTVSGLFTPLAYVLCTQPLISFTSFLYVQNLFWPSLVPEDHGSPSIFFLHIMLHTQTCFFSSTRQSTVSRRVRVKRNSGEPWSRFWPPSKLWTGQPTVPQVRPLMQST